MTDSSKCQHCGRTSTMLPSDHERLYGHRYDTTALPDAADLPRITFERSPAGQYLHDVFMATCRDAAAKYGTITAIECDGVHTSLDELFACAPCMRDLDAMTDTRNSSQVTR